MKIKVTSIIILVLILLPILSIFSNTKAYDPNIKLENQKINFIGIMNIDNNRTGKAKVDTSSALSNYNLAYQSSFISKDTINKVNDIIQKNSKKIEEINKRVQELQKQAEKIYNEYNAKLKSGTVTEQELKKIKENYEELRTNIEKEVKNAEKANEEASNEMSKILPGFNDSNWKSTTRTNENIVVNNVPEDVGGILVWVKASNNTETLYNFKIYTADIIRNNNNNNNNNNETQDNNQNNNSKIKLEYIFEIEAKILISEFKGQKDRYKIYISETNNKVTDEDIKPSETSSKYINENNGKYTYSSDKLNDLLEQNKDVYVTIVKLKENDISKIDEIIVDRHKMNHYPLYYKDYRTFRLSFIRKNDYQIITNFPMKNKNERKAQIKIGKISDVKLLNSYKNNPTSTTEELLKYAKTNNGILNTILDNKESLNTTTIKFINSNKSLIDDINKLENDAYYYIYLKMDDENGKYEPLESVTISKASVFKELDNKSWSLFVYGDERFKWSNLGDVDNTQAKGRLPQTGVRYISYVGILAIFTTLGIATYKKYKNNKI